MNDRFINDLLVRLRGGDSEAAGVLYALSQEAFYRAARKHALSHEDAEDTVQTTFLKLLKATSNGDYDPARAGGSGWIWRIFTHAMWDIRRQKPTAELTEDLIENGLRDEVTDSNPVERTEEREIRELVQRAVRELSKTERRELLRGRGKRGPKRASLRQAEEHLRARFHELYERGLKGDP